MTDDVIDPNLQHPLDRTTVAEYLLMPGPGEYHLHMHDGWRPLCVRGLEHATYVVALVDTRRTSEAEVIHVVVPGTDLEALSQFRGKELTYLGHDFRGHYLFLEVEPAPEEPVEVHTESKRRIGRLDIEGGMPRRMPARRIGRLDLEESSSSGLTTPDPGIH
jgi:hypothetical protein